jgi:hypothetical protein
MKHATPAPPELGTRNGLSLALFLPEGEPELGAVILHGAGSCGARRGDLRLDRLQPE